VTYDSADHCQRALGYLELGMAEDAWDELAALPTEFGELKPVKQLRVEILGRLKRWGEAAELCLPMLESEPSELFWWIQGAYTVRRSESIEAAELILRRALAHHPPDNLLLYNLACYACVQGRMEEARDFLNQAILGNPETVVPMSLKDEDLVALRPWILKREAELRSAALPILPPLP